MAIAITGHKGYIGSHLFKRLAPANPVGIDFREGYNLLTCELPKDIDLIYHLAAQADVEASWHDPLNDLNNIRITARLVHAYPNAKIIYANSCASVDPVSPYGFSKWASGEYIKRFHKNWVSCIFPNVYGDGGHSVVDKFKGQDEVTIYGTGKQTRDYVHVDDIVEGLVLAHDWKKGEYFMGSGISTDVLTLAGERKINFAPARKEPFEVVVPNTTPNWKPKVEVLKYITT